MRYELWIYVIYELLWIYILWIVNINEQSITRYVRMYAVSCGPVQASDLLESEAEREREREREVIKQSW